ncbi:MAG TPA: tetratricopeptide repeat protein, partial [Nannocystaceae bacterium]|nr:tetratricopeptide repeat protein [Nannocystaceae bacterium]
LADVQFREGRADRAVELQRRSFDGFVAALGAEHPRTAQAQRKLGWLLVRADRRAEGREHMERAKAAIERAFGSDHDALVTSLFLLAELDSVEGDQAGSLALLERARAIELRQHPPSAESLSRIDDSIAIALAGLGRHAESLEVHRRVLDAQEERLGPDHPDLRYDLNNLALAGRDSGRPDDAEAWFRRAIAIDDAQTAHDGLSPSLHFNLGFLLLDRGELDEATAEFERARAIGSAVLPPGDPELAWAIMGLGRVALARGRDPQAIDLFEDALARWDVGTDRVVYRELQRDHVLALWSVGQRRRALTLAREALAADPEHAEIAAFVRARAR